VAPSEYLEQIETDKVVQLSRGAMDAILWSHCITPTFLRSDDFEGFYADRKAALLRVVEGAMGKHSIVTSEAPAEDAAYEEDEEGEEMSVVAHGQARLAVGKGI